MWALIIIMAAVCLIPFTAVAILICCCCNGYSRHSSDVQLKVARFIEQRPNRDDELALTEALEDDGCTADEVHTMCAEDAYHEQNMRSAKQFYRVWMAAVRLEFPLRSNRPSDRACMTKWLSAQMRAKGMRITHIEDAIPRIVAMAINPSRAEVEAEEMGAEADAWRTVSSSKWASWMPTLGRETPGRKKWE